MRGGWWGGETQGRRPRRTHARAAARDSIVQHIARFFLFFSESGHTGRLAAPWAPPPLPPPPSPQRLLAKSSPARRDGMRRRGRMAEVRGRRRRVRSQGAAVWKPKTCTPQPRTGELAWLCSAPRDASGGVKSTIRALRFSAAQVLVGGIESPFPGPSRGVRKFFKSYLREKRVCARKHDKHHCAAPTVRRSTRQAPSTPQHPWRPWDARRWCRARPTPCARLGPKIASSRHGGAATSRPRARRSAATPLRVDGSGGGSGGGGAWRRGGRRPRHNGDDGAANGHGAPTRRDWQRAAFGGARWCGGTQRGWAHPAVR